LLYANALLYPALILEALKIYFPACAFGAVQDWCGGKLFSKMKTANDECYHRRRFLLCHPT
jgi:hypothetical protein